MLKRFGASSKHRKAAGALKSPTIIVAGQPETNEEEPASIIEHNKVTLVCEAFQWEVSDAPVCFWAGAAVLR